jgi:hypothetical protein
MIVKIVSGGQTGADQGGLNAAIACGVDHGGWCPKGRRSENGRIPLKYDLKEHGSWQYIERTEQNVIDSDATAIFTFGPLTGGSARTVDFCLKHKKPYIHIDLLMENDEQDLIDFIGKKDVVLNVAGNRESKAKGIASKTEDFLLQCLKLQIK